MFLRSPIPVLLLLLLLVITVLHQRGAHSCGRVCRQAQACVRCTLRRTLAHRQYITSSIAGDAVAVLHLLCVNTICLNTTGQQGIDIHAGILQQHLEC